MEVFVETLKVVCCSEYPNIPMSTAGTIMSHYGGICQDSDKHKSG